MAMSYATLSLRSRASSCGPPSLHRTTQPPLQALKRERPTMARVAVRAACCVLRAWWSEQPRASSCRLRSLSRCSSHVHGIGHGARAVVHVHVHGIGHGAITGALPTYPVVYRRGRTRGLQLWFVYRHCSVHVHHRGRGNILVGQLGSWAKRAVGQLGQEGSGAVCGVGNINVGRCLNIFFFFGVLSRLDFHFPLPIRSPLPVKMDPNIEAVRRVLDQRSTLQWPHGA